MDEQKVAKSRVLYEYEVTKMRRVE